MGKTETVFICFGVLSILISSSSSIANSSNVIQWIKVQNDELPLLGLEIAGIENNKKLYLAQIDLGNETGHTSYSFPATLQIGNEIKATIIAWAEEHSFSEFLVLDAPRGSLSWIPLLEDDPIPSDAVVGGMETTDAPDGMILYICRVAPSEGNLIPGRLLSANKDCIYGYNGTEHSTKTGVEILVRNQLGKEMGTRLG